MAAQKDYSSTYREDNNCRIVNPPVPSSRARIHKASDGSFAAPRHIESGLDLRAVVEKLRNLPQDNNHYVAVSALNNQYSRVFRQTQHQNFKVYVKYNDEVETYVVYVDQNTLGAVKNKLPKRDSSFRYFFKGTGAPNELEEIENDRADVPYHDRNGTKNVYCRVLKP